MQYAPSSFRKRFVLLLLASAFSSVLALGFQENLPLGQGVPLHITWYAQGGVTSYRLQVATDEQFNNVVFDRAVTGTEFTVSVLPKGRYFWRVAPIAGDTPFYSVPHPVTSETTVPAVKPTPTPFVSKPLPTPVVERPRQPMTQSMFSQGWRAVTGRSLVPRGVVSGTGHTGILITDDPGGNVFAFDALTGEGRWSAPVNRSGSSPSRALGHAIRIFDFGSISVVAVANGSYLRALNSLNGHELWRTDLPATVSQLTSVDFEGNGKTDVVAITVQPAKMIVVDGATGKVVSQTVLSEKPINGLFSYSVGIDRGIALATNGGLIEVRGRSGELLRSSRLDVEITTSPLLARTSKDVVMTLGSSKGFLALDPVSLKPMWRIDTPDDVVSGQFLVPAAGNSRADDILVYTRGRLIACIDSSTGKIKWNSKAMEGDKALTLADTNNDGISDIVILARDGSLRALSGVDGSTVIAAENAGPSGLSNTVADMLPLVTLTNNGGTYIFLPDSDGLRSLHVNRNMGANPVSMFLP